MDKIFDIYVQRLTRQGALSESARQGDSYRVIDNPLTCQGALCSRSKRTSRYPTCYRQSLDLPGSFMQSKRKARRRPTCHRHRP